MKAMYDPSPSLMYAARYPVSIPKPRTEHNSRGRLLDSLEPKPEMFGILGLKSAWRCAIINVKCKSRAAGPEGMANIQPTEHMP